jgi:multisubunit Na+/H+ antiporter MnhB subunit
MSLATRTVSRLLLAPALMIAAAVLVKGYADTGDGFNAGVIAALAILLQYVVFGAEEAERLLPVRRAGLCAVAGLGLSLVVAFTPLLRGDALFTHVPGPGKDVVKLGTVELITAVAFDVGVFLLVFGAIVGALRLIALHDRTAELERPPAGGAR